MSSTGSATAPIAAIVPSTTRVPRALPSTGAMNPSPQGRLPKAPGALSSPASAIASRSPSPSRRSEPFAQVIRASAPALSSAAIAPPLRRRPSMSALITRASISSVAPGRVATRTPASVAARRAAVWESDCTVGARTTSAATIAAATPAGGSAACEARSAIRQSTPSAPARPASARRRSPRPIVAGLQITSSSSPSVRPMHSRTIALTARSRSLIGAQATRRPVDRSFATPPVFAHRRELE